MAGWNLVLLFLVNRSVSPPRVEGVGGLAREPLVLIFMTDRCCGTRSARILGASFTPLGV